MVYMMIYSNGSPDVTDHHYVKHMTLQIAQRLSSRRLMRCFITCIIRNAIESHRTPITIESVLMLQLHVLGPVWCIQRLYHEVKKWRPSCQKQRHTVGKNDLSYTVVG